MQGHGSLRMDSVLMSMTVVPLCPFPVDVTKQFSESEKFQYVDVSLSV